MTQSKQKVICRFAPSPNGYLHKGHGYSALLNAQAAATLGGTFLLRIEDIDQTRCKPVYTTTIFEDLRWLGLAWDQEVWVQSTRFSFYKAALERLDTMGLLYKCTATRSEIKAAIAQKNDPNWPKDPDGTPLYPALSKHMTMQDVQALETSNRPFALRLHMDRALATIKDGPLYYYELNQTGGAQRITADPSEWGDVILARKDTPTSYHLACTLDDGAQNITHVIRGKELQAATSIHLLLQRLLDLPTPFYFHHDLIVDNQGQKLAKSTPQKDHSLRALRLAGEPPQKLIDSFDFTTPLTKLSCA